MANRSSILNRGEIVSQGLEEGGNPGISTLANTFLNLFLDQLAASYDWPWLLVEESITISKNSKSVDLTSLNETFGKAMALHLDGADQNPRELQEWPHGFIDLRTRMRRADENAETGEPRYFYPDPTGEKLWIFPIAEKSYDAALWYYKMPATLTDDTDTPWVPDATVMVAAVADFAARYDGEPMHQILNRNVQIAKSFLKPMAEQAGRQTQLSIPFDKNVHKWRRFR